MINTDTVPTAQDAQRWLQRWDRQQETYLPDREERFAVITDVVALATGRPDPLVVDLGAGPGSLAVRLLDRLPEAAIVAVDADPLLLGLARAAYGQRPGLRIVDHDLRRDDWSNALALPRPADALVSTTALHWLTRPELAAVYRGAATVLRAGGVLVNGDHLHEPAARPTLGDITEQVAARRAERVALPPAEDWQQWWTAVGAAPELDLLVGARGARPLEHTVPDVPSLDEHVALLLEAGFTEASTVWQHGHDRVLVAVR